MPGRLFWRSDDHLNRLIYATPCDATVFPECLAHDRIFIIDRFSIFPVIHSRLSSFPEKYPTS